MKRIPLGDWICDTCKPKTAKNYRASERKRARDVLKDIDQDPDVATKKTLRSNKRNKLNSENIVEPVKQKEQVVAVSRDNIRKLKSGIGKPGEKKEVLSINKNQTLRKLALRKSSSPVEIKKSERLNSKNTRREPETKPLKSLKMNRTKSAPVVLKRQKLITESFKPIQNAKDAVVETEKSAPSEISTAKYFGGKLSYEEANTEVCKPGLADRQYFEASMEILNQPKESSDLESYVAVPKIPKIQIGAWNIDTWYAAPYPQEYNILPCLYICEFCFKYMKSDFSLARHMKKCPHRHPPGTEIYRDGSISIFEVDGRKHKIYCQNLCLLAKIFLDHKTLYYDVEPFLFYIMTEQNQTGAHFIGYFSKYILLTLGYLLTAKEEKYGSPEKPLSDLGLLSYRNYWRMSIIKAILSRKESKISIADLMSMTRMTADDVVHTLRLLEMIHKSSDGSYIITCNIPALETYMKKVAAKGYLQVKPELLKWDPVLLNRVMSPCSHFSESPI